MIRPPQLLAFAFAFMCCNGQGHAITLGAEGTNPDWPAHVSPGSTIALKIYPQPTQPARWYHDGARLSATTGDALALTSVQPSDSGNYWVEIGTGAALVTSNVFTLNVVPAPTSIVDRSFAAALPPNASVRAVANGAADGSLLITYSVASGANQVRKLRADGAHDASFTAPSIFGSVLLVLPNGQVVVSVAPYLLEPTGAPLSGFALGAGFDAAQPLTSALSYSDGQLIIAQGTHLARWTTDGAPDPTFVYHPPELAGVTIYPGRLGLDPSGRIYVNARAAQSSDLDATIVFRLTPSGGYDPTFQVQQGASRNSYLATTPLDDGRLFRKAVHVSSLIIWETWTLLREDGTTDPSWAADESLIFQSEQVDKAASRLFVALPGGELSRWSIASEGLRRDTDFYAGQFTDPFPVLCLDRRGDLLVGGSFAEWNGVPANGLVRLRGSASSLIVPVVTISSSTVAPRRGETVTLSATIQSGTGPFEYQWIALDGQPIPSDSPSASLTISDFQPQHLGRYQVRVKGAAGTALSSVLDLRIEQQPAILANLSARAMTGDGEDTLIAGLIVEQSSTALVRGVGPSLADFSVAGFALDPVLKLFDGDGGTVTSNDNWEENNELDWVRSVSNDVSAFPLKPNSHDAALVRWLNAGNFSAHLHPAPGAAHGVAMLEVYADGADTYNWPSWALSYPRPTKPLRNLSMRANTGPGDAIAIAGLIIVDPLQLGRSARVLLRAVGPTLSTQGIVHPLENPVLNVFNGQGERIASNDDWANDNTSGDEASLAAAMKQVGAFELPAESKDSALLLDLAPGAYTMHANGGTGVVLLEIYLVR